MALACSESSDDASQAQGNTAQSTTATVSSSSSSAGGSSGSAPATSGGDAVSSTDTGVSAAGGSGGSGGSDGDAGANTSGGAGGSGGSGGAASPSTCKRGIAANVAPGPAFSDAVSWWNNWAIRGDGAGDGIEFVPMIWGGSTAGDEIPDGSRFLLGFNEPNFFAQANLSAEQAAAAWPEVEASARSQGVPIVSPAMNYCGPADQCHDTDPYAYLRDFFAACSDCQVDYVAVHWYNCDLPSLRDYLEPGDNLEGFEQFGKPIWLTEFSCDPGASVEEQEAYMREAIPYLEDNPNVFRYSWFSAGPIPNARLINDDGSPTGLGETYIELPQSCD